MVSVSCHSSQYSVVNVHAGAGRSDLLVRYDVLAKWWADVVKPTRTRLYIGIAFYKVGEPSKIEPDWMINGGVPELKKQLDLNDAVPEISGTILFREDYLNKPQTQQAVSYLQSRWGS